MRYQDLYNQYLNYYNNPNTAQAPEVPIARPPSQTDAMVGKGAGLLGKGAGMYAGSKLGNALGLGGKNALSLTANPPLPASYTTGTQLASPKIVGAKVVGGQGASAGASGALGTAGNVLGAAGGLYGLYNLYDSFGQGGAEGRKSGAASGAAAGAAAGSFIPGLGTAAGALIGALIGLGTGSAKTGKSRFQRKREAMRGKLAEAGILEDLGSKVYSVNFEGQDPFTLGRSGDFYKDSYDRSIKDLSKVLGRDAEKMANNKRMGWDIDYTSDLDLMTSGVGRDLGRLIGGSNFNTNIEHGFNELVNASLADTDREFNKENWANTMGDMRSLYERAGFEDANAAYERLNELVASGAIDDKAKEEMMQSIGMAYGDNSFDLANQINQGRWTGVDMEGAGIANDINLPLDPLANVDTTNLVTKPGTLSQEQAEMLAGALA